MKPNVKVEGMPIFPLVAIGTAMLAIVLCFLAAEMMLPKSAYPSAKALSGYGIDDHDPWISGRTTRHQTEFARLFRG